MSITLDESGLLHALDLRVGEPLLGEFILKHAMAHHEGGVLLSWSERGGRRTVGLQVRARDDARPAWRRSLRLDTIVHLPEGEEVERLLQSLGVLVDRLERLDTGHGSVEVPEPPPTAPPPRRLSLSKRRQTSALSPFDFGRVFVLDLESDCHQRCSFCSTRAKWSPVGRFTDETWVKIDAGLRGARSDGYDVLRLSGLDPLTHPYVIDAIRRAAELGYETLHIYSPSTRYAEPGFLSAVLEASADMKTFFHVPLYGANGAAHDAVTGSPGSFDRVVKGLELLVEHGQESRLVLLSVLTRRSLAHWPDLVRLMRRWAAPVQVFLPFPATRSHDDAFFEVATTHEEALSALASAPDGMEGLAEILPCVRYRYERATGTPTLTQGPFHPVTAWLGTLFEHADYRRLEDGAGPRFTIPTVACPHAEDCGLATYCPQGVYASYAARFGLSELRPVSAEELEALGFEL